MQGRQRGGLEPTSKFDEYKDGQEEHQEEIKEEGDKNVVDDLKETLEEIVVKVDEGKILALGTNHPPKNHEHLSLFLTSSEPLLKASNFEIRTFKEWVQLSPKGPVQIRFN